MASYLITGASKGLGFELTRQLAILPEHEVSKVFATVRGDAPALHNLAKSEASGRIAIVRLDVSDEKSIKQAEEEVRTSLNGKGLDVLINNAGILQYSPSGVSAMDNLRESLTTNVLGVHWVTRNFIPLLQQGRMKKIINISTTLGSIAIAPAIHLFPAPAYKISKAAMNALTVQYALEYAKEDFTVIALAPGWLRSELGGKDADLSVEQGAKASLEKIAAVTTAQNGHFIKIRIEEWEKAGYRNVYDGADAPW